MKNKGNLVIITLLLLIVFVSTISLVLGEQNYSLNDLIQAFTNSNSDYTMQLIIKDVRLPRIIAGIFTGATLALSGLVLRTLLKNPLADTAVLGVSSGASFLVVCILILVPSLFSFIPIFAFIGGLAAFAMSATLAVKKGKIEPIKMIIAGVAINAFFNGLLAIVNVFNKDKLALSVSYLGGSLANISFDNTIYLVIYGTIAILVAYFIFPIIKMLRLDDGLIKNLGKNPHKMRMLAAIVGVTLATVSLSYVGIISFVGILVPFFAYNLIKDYNHQYFITTALLGGLLVIVCDLGQRLIFSPMEIPVGTIIGLLGAPMFLYFVKSERENV